MNSIPHSSGLIRGTATPAFLVGGGMCGDLIRERDWSRSTLGRPSDWPGTLKVVLSTVLCSPVPTALFWGQDAVLLYNDGYATLAASRHPALLGRPLHDAWPELREFHEGVLGKVLSGDTLSLHNQELTVERDGLRQQAFFDIVYSPVRAEDGCPAGVMVVVLETTEAVLDARALREAEAQARIDAERLQLALDAGAILGTWNWDPLANCFTADHRFADSFGLDPQACREGLPSEAMAGTVVPEDLPDMQHAVAQALGRGGPYSHQCRVRLADGTTRWIEATGRVDLAPDGKPVRFPGVFLDITARKAAEEALKAVETRASEAAAELKAILDTAPVPILIARDRAASRIEANRAAREVMRIPAEDANLSKSGPNAALRVGHYRVFDTEGVEFTPERLPLQRAARGERIEIFDERVVFADGEERWFQGRAVPLLDADGQPRGAVGAFTDITLRKKAEADLQRSEARFRGVFSAGVIGFAIYDVANGETLEINDRFLEMTGHTREDFEEGRWDWKTFTPPEYLPLSEAAVVQLRETGRYEPFEKEYLRRDGTRFPVRLSAAALPGEPGRIVVAIEDISAQRASQAALAESEKRFRNMADHSPAIVWVTSPDGGFTYLNARWFEVTGQSEADILKHGWHRAIHPEDLAICEPVFAEAQKRKVPFKVEFRLRAASGDWMWVLDAAAPRWGADGSFQGFVGSMIDITDRKEAEEALARERAAAEHAAHHDSLTGLPNRAWFRSRLEEQLSKVGSDRQLALHFLDLDGFASVNDSLGHPAGDALLRAAAARLRDCLRGSDLIARFGGDEFAIMQTGVTDPEQPGQLARRIIDRLSVPYLVDGGEVVVATSIGIAMAQDPTDSADALLKRSDIALYQAKAAGRGVHRFFEPAMEEAAQEEQRVRAELRDALAREQFRLHFQPVVDLEEGRVLSFEALLRWQHPRRGLLGPAGFICLAEETGAIEEIGAWVLKEACATAATWPESVTVSVNLSPRQFRTGRLVKEVCLALRDGGLPASRLTLEITESILLQDEELVHRTLDALRGLGARISIDDFGTGYSSLGYLRRFAVDAIKIDRSFVGDLPSNPKANAIVRAALALSADLHVDLIAEGVETVLQMDQLKALGCRQGQGYLFSRPIPAEEVAGYLIAFSPPSTHHGGPETGPET